MPRDGSNLPGRLKSFDPAESLRRGHSAPEAKREAPRARGLYASKIGDMYSNQCSCSRMVWSGPRGYRTLSRMMWGGPHASAWVNNVIAKRYRFYYLFLCNYDF